MRQGVAILAPGVLEGALVQAIDAESEVLVVVRRCADLAEVRASAGAGLAPLGVIDGEDPDLDAVLVEDLHGAGMRLVVLTGTGDGGPAGDDGGAGGRLRSIGADAVADAHSAETVVTALLALAGEAVGPAPGEVPGGPDAGSGARDLSWTGTSGGRVGAPGTAPGARVDDGGPGADTADGVPGAGEELGPGVQPQPGGILAVWGTSGAPGRSTVALNVAAVLARDRQVILVDADTAAPSVAHMLGLPVDAPGLAALSRFAARGALGEDEVGRALVPVTEGLSVLTGLSLPQRWNEVSPEALRSVLEVVSHVCDLVVVDLAAGSLDPVPTRTRHRGGRDEVVSTILRAAHTSLSVCRGDPVGINRLALSHQWWEELGAEAEPSVVVNGVSAQASGRRPSSAVSHAVSAVVPDRRVHLVPRDEAVPAALLRAGAVVDLAPTSGASRAFVELAEAVGGSVWAAPGRRRRRSWGWRRS